MAEALQKYFPFNAVIDDNGEPDRVYSAEDFTDYFAQFVGDGVYPNPATMLKVNSNNNMIVTVNPGAGFVKGHGYILKEPMEISINAPNASYNRRDTVVLQLDLVDRTLLIKYKPGQANANPQDPALIRTEDTWELKLASILVRNGTQAVTQADITDTRLDKSVCGIVQAIVNQVDTTEIFNQYDAYWQAKQVEWANKGLAQEALWQSQMDSQESRFTSQHDDINTWWQNIQADIDLMVPFDFDNIASKPGAKRSTEFLSNGNIEESIVIALNNRKVANRNTVFNTNGSIAITQIVYKDDGAVFMQTTTTTVFNADGSITEEVS